MIGVDKIVADTTRLFEQRRSIRNRADAVVVARDGSQFSAGPLPSSSTSGVRVQPSPKLGRLWFFRL